jgi:hypothetical protein
MTQLELPLCSVFRVKIQTVVEVDVPAESPKAAKKFVEQHYFPQIGRAKILGIYRADMVPAAEENEDDTPGPKPDGNPRGRPNPGGTQGGGSVKPIPKPVDAIAKAS